MVATIWCFDATAQKITPSEEKNGVSVTWQDGKFCKYLFIQRKNRECNRPLVYYSPFYSCSGKKKIKKKSLNFSEDATAILQMFDSARVFMVIDMCTFNMNMGDYDDLVARQIDAFAASEEWQKYTYHKDLSAGGTVMYDRTLVAKIMKNANVLAPVDSLLTRLGFRIAVIHPSNGEMALVPKAVLKKLGKSTELQIPLPDPIRLQVSSVPQPAKR